MQSFLDAKKAIDGLELIARLEAGTIDRPEAIHELTEARRALMQTYSSLTNIQRSIETDPQALANMRLSLADELFKPTGV
jgi:hypothetical protein